jgi:hypothetical protein
VAKVFGGRVHADHVFPRDIHATDDDRAEETTALALRDDATEFRGFYPQRTKSTSDNSESIRHFVGRQKLVALRTDNSREFIRKPKNSKYYMNFQRLIAQKAVPGLNETSTGTVLPLHSVLL